MNESAPDLAQAISAIEYGSSNNNGVPETPGATLGATEVPVPVEPQHSATEVVSEERPGWLRRNLLKLSLGAFVGSTAVSAVVSPGFEKDVLQAAPWVAAGMGVSESMWVGGATLMAASAGKKIGNPFKLRSRWGEISQSVADSKMFKTGLAINALGALGTAGVVEAGAVTSLPPETWPGATGIAAADMASTVAIRAGIYAGLKQAGTAEKAEKHKVKVRTAKPEDIDRLADLDILLFDKAYGTKKPPKEEVVSMLTKRYENNPDWMFVAEMDGTVEGYVTAFRTSKSAEEFESWEESTAEGTLEGKVDPKGEYLYVANMTIKHEAVEQGAEEMLLANLFAKGIAEGCRYGYFTGRIPHFKRWLDNQGIQPDSENRQQLAEQYLQLRDAKGKRYDPQVRMYEGYGFKPQRMVPNAFEDEASLNFGIVYKATPPFQNFVRKVKPLRLLVGSSLRQLAKRPRLLNKVI